MAKLRMLLLAGIASVSASPVLAADALKMGPAPSWVRPQAIPAAAASDAPLQILLEDEQISLSPGKITTYTEGALKIQNAQGLAAGNVAMVWQPETDTVTVNKLQIIRDGKIIDVLAGGQTFTVLRRETNLDAATLDGTLTATLQPEGLQEGDIVVLATTEESSDPVMKGHVEALFGAWGGLPIRVAHASVQWPSSLRLNLRQTANLPGAQKKTANGITTLELLDHDVQPLVAPKGAPDRFTIGRLAEATDYSSWSDVADLMIPLFKTASTIPASGPLHDEVEKIRAASSDPIVRTAEALALVQNRVRYVALLMGQGGYVPASAEQTWSRRFGDCKAKTALLVGILHSLGIEAEPVLAQTKSGDMIADRLPMMKLFNHVLVRAHVGGRDYWLDGTRTGDTDLNAIATPDFGWSLPLVAHAQLVHLIPKPLDVPSTEHLVTIDASGGIYADAAITVREIYREDSAIELNTLYSAVTAAQRDEAMRDKVKTYFDGFTISDSSVHFDKAKREFEIAIKGSAKLSWKDSWFYVPTSSVGYDPDFGRAAGPFHDAPEVVAYPSYVKDRVTIRLPKGFAARQKLEPAVHETLVGTEYARSETVDGDTLIVDLSERSIAPEVAYKDALAAESRLRALSKDDVYLSSNGAYQATPKDLSAMAEQAPTSADDYVNRGNLYLNAGKYDLAIADMNAALKIDPENKIAVVDRALAHVWKHEFDEAKKDLATVEAQDSNNAVALRARGLMAELGNDCTAAIAFFTKSLGADPQNGFALGHRAYCEAETGKGAEAVADAAAALKEDPNWTALHMVRAHALVQSGKLFDAVAEADSIAKDPSATPFALITAANIYADSKQKEKAFAALTRAGTIANQNEQSMLARAQLLYRLGKSEEALAATEQALKTGFKSPDIHLLRANLLMTSGKRDLVPAEAEAAMRDNPKSDYAFVSAAKMLDAVGQKEKALKAFDGALAIKPEAYIYLNRSQVRAKSDTSSRLADLEAALKLEPANPDVLAEKARLLASTGKYEEALAALDRIKGDDTDRFARTQRAIVLYKAAHTDQSRQLFDALRASARSAGELNSLCWAKGTEGILLESALDDCQEALKRSPGVGGYEDSLGMVLLKLGRLDEALKAYDDAVAKNTGAASLMGRAFVHLRRGERAQAEADAAGARKISQTIDDVFADYHLKFDDSSAAKTTVTAAK